MSEVWDIARGTLWSFSFEVQGFPWVYTDGVASWTSKWTSPHVEVPGALATRDFAFKWLSNPQDPLETGSGISVDLIDDGTDTLFRTWSKDYRGRSGYGRLTSTLGAGSGDTTVYVTPTSSSEALPVDSFMFIGRETAKVTNASTPGQRTVDRAQFSTLRDEHRVFDDVRPLYSTSPTVFGGRVATVWVAPVDPLTGLLDTAEARPIWAGVIKAARIVDEKVRVDCEPLSHILKDDWPSVIPSATLLPRKVGVWSPNAQGVHLYYIQVRFNRTGEEFRLRLGEFDSAGNFALKALTTPIDISIDTYLKWIQDTIIHFVDNDVRSPSAGISNFRMGAIFSLSTHVVSEGTGGASVREVEIRASYASVWGVLDVIKIRGYRLPGGDWDTIVGRGQPQTLARVVDEMSFITAEQTELRIKLDRPAHPFQTTWSWDGNDESEVGFAIIANGTDHELVRFSSATIDSDDPRICTLEGCARGYAGTKARVWGAKEEDGRYVVDDVGAVTLMQPLMVAEPSGEQAGGNVQDLIPASSAVLHVLTSTPSRGQNGSYDLLDGYRQGRLLPKRWVDIKAFEAVARRHNIPLLSAFWVNEVNKGKESLSEVLKMAGLYLVERRFLDDDGDWQYGLSIESIDLPSNTAYGRSVTDADQLSGTRGSTTHNERLVINSTKIKPFVDWGAKEAKGEEIFVWDEWSIGEYGSAKTLEFKPRAVLGTFNNRTGGEMYQDREASIAWMYEVSNRWFAAFGRGTYGGAIDIAAPVGYHHQMGDLVYIDLSALRASDGTKGLVAVGQIRKVEHVWGSRSKAHIEWTSNIERFCELAPVAQGTLTGKSTILLQDNTYTYEGDRGPFGTGWAAKDIQWFDPAAHGAAIKVKGWKIGLYASTVQEFTISSANLSTGVVTTVEKVDLLFGAGATIIFTLSSWPTTTTALSRLYAYVGDAAGLGTGDESKEYS